MGWVKELDKLLREGNFRVTFTGWKAELEVAEKKLKIAMDSLNFLDAGNNYRSLADEQKIAMFHNNNLEVQKALRLIKEVDRNGSKP